LKKLKLQKCLDNAGNEMLENGQTVYAVMDICYEDSENEPKIIGIYLTKEDAEKIIANRKIKHDVYQTWAAAVFDKYTELRDKKPRRYLIDSEIWAEARKQIGDKPENIKGTTNLIIQEIKIDEWIEDE